MIDIKTLIGFIAGMLFTAVVVQLYFRRAMYGGELFVDRTYKRPDIYVEFDKRYSEPVEVAKQRYILLRVRVVRSSRRDCDDHIVNPQNNHAL